MNIAKLRKIWYYISSVLGEIVRLSEEIDTDIHRFFDQVEDQLPEDKRKTLKLLLDKYIHLSTVDHLMDKNDYESIVSAAKYKYSNETFKESMGKTHRKIHPTEQANLFVIEATITHLSSNDCLKKNAKFDYNE